MEKKEGQNGP